MPGCGADLDHLQLLTLFVLAPFLSAMAYLVGASREIIHLARSLGYRLEGIIDTASVGEEIDGCPVLGDDDWLLGQQIPSLQREVILTPDAPSVRSDLLRMYEEGGFSVVRLVAGTVKSNVEIGRGSIVQNPSHVSVGGVVGKGAKVNCGANIMHDASVADFVTVAPNAVLLGYVTVEEKAYIGANATILPNVSVGTGAVVGAGAVVTRDVPAGETVKGIPAR
jgi:sugar O-acyltransferase (sialic acid O-acetyltransferase NeuD family)